ncbi:hypothetical protein, partial [Ralstonia pseudosolanacearum]|uniref:hypothetical protein n=1 Tax=Ralstonia pseudosolanacearum TaxID=1310165 RepID=UPI003CFB56C6
KWDLPLQFVIEPATATVAWDQTSDTAYDAVKGGYPYDAQEHAPVIKVTAKHGTADVTLQPSDYEVSDPNAVNAGDYTVQVTLKNSNYTLATSPAEIPFKVVPRDVQIA